MEVHLGTFSRRNFLLKSGRIVGATTLLSETHYKLMAGSQSRRINSRQQSSSSGGPLYNADVRTAIGLGDELASIVDRFGQVKSRRAEVHLELGTHGRPVSSCQSSQSLEGGYLPIVQTNLRSPDGDLGWVAFASAHQNLKCDYVGIKSAEGAYRITLLFPFTTSITVGQGIVSGGDELLATFPQPQRVAFTQAKYNCLTPETLTWSLGEGTHLPADVDPAFGGGRTVAQGGHALKYRFPVRKEVDHHVFLGLLLFDAELDKAVQRVTVNGQRRVVNLTYRRMHSPTLFHFVTAPIDGEINVQCEADPSTTDPYSRLQLNGIWIFDHPVQAKDVVSGKESGDAVFYVQCGREPVRDMASAVVLDYGPQSDAAATRWITLPYESRRSDTARSRNVSPESAVAAVKARWDALLAAGTEISTGCAKLDNLYKSSVINMFLLREKCEGAGSDGGDLYVVKPGATDYDNFWYRDGCYIITALATAGHADESEKSLRLIWQSGLKGMFACWGQQESGLWQAPITEWDGQGQALWALINHYELTRDKTWLRQVYNSIRKGALWIKNATEQTSVQTLFGERPIYYGLLPKGEGEGVEHGGGDYYYYHDFWAVIGLRQAMLAAEALGEADDFQWMKGAYVDLCSNLKASLELAFERVGEQEFIPATPYNPEVRKWGALWALYPCRFLEPNDPMMTNLLAFIDRDSREDLYHFSPGYSPGQELVWTYITPDLAMCHLLRNELSTFYRFFNGYVAHATPTNVWVEIIDINKRTGVGDMPHGWAAAQYALLLRNALVFENQTDLQLCWGVQPKWFHDGSRIVVKRAPTRFGKLDLELERSGQALLLEYHLEPEGGYPSPEEIHFHIPQLKENIVSVQINGKVRALSPGMSVITLP
jgi:GH15 family glucan-1,4-alpha-glucosidase